jgi:hypothetical protein
MRLQVIFLLYEGMQTYLRLCLEGRRLCLIMASKQTYPCFACRKAGYEIPVYLDGKDPETGKTKYLNEDGTKHVHKTKEVKFTNEFHGTPEQHEEQDSVLKLLPSMNEKLDRLLNLAERK